MWMNIEVKSSGSNVYQCGLEFFLVETPGTDNRNTSYTPLSHCNLHSLCLPASMFMPCLSPAEKLMAITNTTQLSNAPRVHGNHYRGRNEVIIGDNLEPAALQWFHRTEFFHLRHRHRFFDWDRVRDLCHSVPRYLGEQSKSHGSFVPLSKVADK